MHCCDEEVVMMMESSAIDDRKPLLDLAVSYNPNIGVVKMLMNNHGTVSKAKFRILLFSAVKKNASAEVIQWFVQMANANMSANDGNNLTLLELAAKHNPSGRIIKLLVENGCNVNTVNKDKQTPLHCAAEENPSADVISALVGAGAAVDARDKNQQTPLHRAAGKNPSAEVIKALVSAGANVDARDDYQVTPLHWAAGLNPTNVQPLIDCGANVNLLENRQRSPLFLAATNNHRDAIVALAKAGADPELVKSQLDALGAPYPKSLIRSLFKIK